MNYYFLFLPDSFTIVDTIEVMAEKADPDFNPSAKNANKLLAYAVLPNLLDRPKRCGEFVFIESGLEKCCCR